MTATTRITSKIPILEQRYHTDLETTFLYIVGENRGHHRVVDDEEEDELPLLLSSAVRLLVRLQLIRGGISPIADGEDNGTDEEEEFNGHEEESKGHEEESKKQLEEIGGLGELGAFMEGHNAGQQRLRATPATTKTSDDLLVETEDDFQSCKSLDQGSSSIKSTTDMLQPGKNDIVLGRRFRNIEGSRHLWNLIVEKSLEYSQNPEGRESLCDEILARLNEMQPPARFLRRRENGTWEPVYHRRIRSKLVELFTEASAILAEQEEAETEVVKHDASQTLAGKSQKRNEELLAWLHTATVGSTLLLRNVTEADGLHQLKILCDMVNQTMLSSQGCRLEHGRPKTGSVINKDDYQVTLVTTAPSPTTTEAPGISSSFTESDICPDKTELSALTFNVALNEKKSAKSPDVKANGDNEEKTTKSAGMKPQLPPVERFEAEPCLPTPVASSANQSAAQDSDNRETVSQDDDEGSSASIDDDDGVEELDKETRRRLALTPASLKALNCVTGLKEDIIYALREIKYFGKRSVAKESSIERECEALEHQESLSPTGQTGESVETNNDAATGSTSTIQERTTDYETEWIRLVRSINSLAIVAPTATNIMLHKHRDNNSMQLGTNHIGQRLVFSKGRKYRKLCWLLGTKVYEICSCSERSALIHRLLEICNMLGVFGIPDDTERSDLTAVDWPGFINPIMRYLSNVSSVIHSGQQRSILDDVQHPLAVFQGIKENEYSIQELNEFGRMLDSHFGLTNWLLSNAEQKKQKDFRSSVDKLHKRVSDVLSKRFTHKDTRLTVYGSCLSSISPCSNTDVDMSLYLDRAKYLKKSVVDGKIKDSAFKQERKGLVLKVCENIGACDDFANVTCLENARVPVAKGNWKDAKNPYAEDGSLDFDICLWNDIAVANSLLILEYCSIDRRVQLVCDAVKQWAKGHGISSAADRTLSTYTWTNLVIFYLQAIGFVPNLQCRELAAKAGVSPDKTNPLHVTNNFDTFHFTWEQARGVWKRPDSLETISVTALLLGFFGFYADHLFPDLFVIGLKRARSEIIPKTVFLMCSWFWTVEDPFETFDSHAPQNLGLHAEEYGAKFTRYFVREAYVHVKATFEAVISGRLVDLPSSLLPEATEKQIAQLGDARKRNYPAQKKEKGGSGSKRRRISKRTKKAKARDASLPKESYDRQEKTDPAQEIDTIRQKEKESQEKGITKKKESLKMKSKKKAECSSSSSKREPTAPTKKSGKKDQVHSPLQQNRKIEKPIDGNKNGNAVAERRAFYGGLAHGLLVGIFGTIIVFEIMNINGRRR